MHNVTAWFIIEGGVVGLLVWAVTSLKYEWPRRIFVAPPPAHRSAVDETRLVELVPAIQRQWDLLDEIVAWRHAWKDCGEWWRLPAWAA